MILSIDQSTSATKALLWTPDGMRITRADVPHKQITNQQGWIEHDPTEILNNVYASITQALAQANASFQDIQVMGISNQRETAVCWDRITGVPLYHAIVWQCGRASAITDALSTQGHAQTIKDITGLPLSPYFSAAKFAWMVQHVPEVKQAFNENRLCCGTMDSWLIFKLTGQFKTDYSNASRTQLLNLNKCCWDDKLLHLFGLNINCMPEICMSDDLFGHAHFNQNANIPIHGVLGDSHGALFANECHKPMMAKATYGTGSSIMMNVGTAPPVPPNGIAASIAWGMNNSIQYVLEGNINDTGAVIQWLTDAAELIHQPKDAGMFSKTVEDTNGVYFVPAFSGLGAPYFHNDVRAAWIGINRATKKAHLVRAAEECIAYQIKDVIEVMNTATHQPLASLKVDGGPTKDSFLMQFQADILDIPIHIAQTEERSGMGAAYCAAIGAGLTDMRIFAHEQYHSVHPHMNEDKRDRLYTGWKTAVNTLI